MLLLVVHGQQQVRRAQAITVERYEGRTAMGMAEAVKAQHVLPFLPGYCSFAARMESVMPTEIQPPGGRLELAPASVSECWQVADTSSGKTDDVAHTNAKVCQQLCEA